MAVFERSATSRAQRKLKLLAAARYWLATPHDQRPAKAAFVATLAITVAAFDYYLRAARDEAIGGQPVGGQPASLASSSDAAPHLEGTPSADGGTEPDGVHSGSNTKANFSVSDSINSLDNTGEDRIPQTAAAAREVLGKLHEEFYNICREEGLSYIEALALVNQLNGRATSYAHKRLSLYQDIPRVKAAFKRCLEILLPLDFVAARLRQGVDAIKRTHFLKKDGTVDSIEDVDYEQRGKYLDRTMRALELVKDVPGEHSNNTLQIVWHGPAPPWAKQAQPPSPPALAVDAEVVPVQEAKT